MPYDIQDIAAPRVAGRKLQALALALESGVTGPALASRLLANIGIPTFRACEPTDPLPLGHPSRRVGAGAEGAEGAKGAKGAKDLTGGAALPEDELDGGGTRGFQPQTAARLVAAYRSGEATPEQVAQQVLLALREGDRRDPPMRPLIAQLESDLMEQAQASTARWSRQQPLGPLDGVPVVVKDELDQRPYPTTVGTTFLGRWPAQEDAEVVARLRRAGALLVGKANMQEIGLGVLGYNPHAGSARNPYDPRFLCGGSSSGSAAAVAAGLCPLAVGVDGGGSIRIPAALCGQLGLMGTFGRISEFGAAPVAWSVSHAGPIAATVRDLALAYGVMAGPDPKDPSTLNQPAPRLEGIFTGLDEAPLAGVKVGVLTPWFEHAEAEVAAPCRALLERFEEAGAEVREVELPELGLARTVHLVTIVSEMVASQLPSAQRHGADYSPEIRVNLALGRQLKGSDYVHAQRLRVRLCRHFAAALAEVDLIVTPATGVTAPLARPDALETGASDLLTTGRIMRYAPAANLTGLPAICFPAGYSSRGLPVGMQAMGRYWQEHLLLRLAAVAEQRVERRRPQVWWRLLSDRA